MGPIINPAKIDDHLDVVVNKHYDGLDASLVDIWAAMIGKVLQPHLEKKERTRLSDTQDRVQTCELPFPIYTGVFVKEETPTQAFAGEETLLVLLVAAASAAVGHGRSHACTHTTQHHTQIHKVRHIHRLTHLRFVFV